MGSVVTTNNFNNLQILGGSGGGSTAGGVVVGGASGGYIILISAIISLNNANILAVWQSPGNPNAHIGAGSGGSVTILTNALTVKSVMISVAGGNSHNANSGGQ